MNKFFQATLFVSIILLTVSCTNSKKNDSAPEDGKNIISHASLLSIADYDGYSVAKVTNPWDTTQILATYILVPRGTHPAGLPQGTIVQTPLRSSLVYSGVYGGVINELGAADAITGVADGGYFRDSTIVRRIKTGRIVDVGNSMSPSIEKIVELNPEAILTSPYQNSGHGAIESLGSPIIEMADYMEQTPLGRAEWIKLIGRLYGKTAGADSIYDSVCNAYTSLIYTTTGTKPSVITEQPFEGTWAMPGGNSYMARLIADAGGRYPWADDKSTGSIQLDPAAVIDKAENADIWLIRSYGPLTLDGIRSNIQLASRIKAFRNGGVYVCDTSSSPLFDEFPFHPERLLKDYFLIMHPESSIGTPQYFKRLR